MEVHEEEGREDEARFLEKKKTPAVVIPGREKKKYEQKAEELMMRKLNFL